MVRKCRKAVAKVDCEGRVARRRGDVDAALRPGPFDTEPEQSGKNIVGREELGPYPRAVCCLGVQMGQERQEPATRLSKMLQPLWGKDERPHLKASRK